MQHILNMITCYMEGFETMHVFNHLVNSLEVTLLKFGHLLHQLPKCEKTKMFRQLTTFVFMASWEELHKKDVTAIVFSHDT